jgi:hypothetical protein
MMMDQPPCLMILSHILTTFGRQIFGRQVLDPLTWHLSTFYHEPDASYLESFDLFVEGMGRHGDGGLKS